MSRWFRHYAGMCRDDKLVRAALRCKQPVERVVWVWCAILESAAEIDQGGRFEIDHAEIAYFLRTDEADIAAVEVALRDLGRIGEGSVFKWQDRQFQSDRSAERTRRYRDRQQGRGDGDKNLSDGDVTSQDVTSDVTVTHHRQSQSTETETEKEIAAQPVSHMHVQAREAGEAELLGHLIDAAGLAEPLPPILEDASAIAELVGKGYSLRDRILPVIRARRGRQFGSWAYFVPAIVEAEERGAGIGKARQCTPAAAVWIDEGSQAWAAATRARGKPPVVTYRNGNPGAYVRPSEIEERAA